MTSSQAWGGVNKRLFGVWRTDVHTDYMTCVCVRRLAPVIEPPLQSVRAAIEIHPTTDIFAFLPGFPQTETSCHGI